MRKSLPFWLVIAFSILALVASAILFVDYVKPHAVFCGEEGGCGAMKRTIFAFPLGIPTPVFGISGIFAIALLQLVPGRRARIAQAVLAMVGALLALGFIVVQAMMKTVCPYCIVVDTSALVIGALSILRLVRGSDPPRSKVLALCISAVLLAGIAVPIGIGQIKKPLTAAVPSVIAQEIHKAPRGKLLVIDFADFECPFCRITHTELTPLLEERKEKIFLVRKHVPLRMHPHARDAARAAICGEIMDKRDAMADALFTANDLSPNGCRAIAKSLGLDVEKFDACVKSAATDARIDADTSTFRAAGGHGLPTFWFGTTKVEGAQDREKLRAALDAALEQP
ncbi:MAG: thioredoxin domain-containing protein [Polyangiaceae bacterium]|nr:thioredoxin domain-containing protein [Polyangiaceae bacterium]